MRLASCLVYRNIPDLYRMMRLWKEEAEQNIQSAYINFYKENPLTKRGFFEYLNPLSDFQTRVQLYMLNTDLKSMKQITPGKNHLNRFQSIHPLPDHRYSRSLSIHPVRIDLSLPRKYVFPQALHLQDEPVTVGSQ